MSGIYSFLKDCGVFWVATVNGDSPACRPFGAVAEIDGKLYITTGKGKEVFGQVKASPRIQITALKEGTREWLRLDAEAEEISDLRTKNALLNACPPLTKRFPSAESPDFAVFRLNVVRALLCSDDGKATIE